MKQATKRGMKRGTTPGITALMHLALVPAVVTGALLWPTSGARAQGQKAAPFTAASVAWAKVEASAAELDKTVKAGKLGEVHEVAFSIRDDVVTLPAKSAALSADKKKKLAGYAKTVSETAELLDKYGDSNNAKGVKAQQQRMDATLKSIKALYPTGTFATSGSKMSDTMPGMKGMKMGSGRHEH